MKRKKAAKLPSPFIGSDGNLLYHAHHVPDIMLYQAHHRPVDFDGLDCTGLKEYYSTTLCRASPIPWYNEYTWDIDEVYTELALGNSATSKFDVEELFEQCDLSKYFPKGGSYRVLIEGDAGYGKSTLMLKIASDWSNSDSNDKTNYTSRFSLLLVVKLGFVGEDGNLLSYMESIYSEKMDTPLKNVLKSKRAEVLILLDGYDGANTNTKREVDRIMKKETMSKCHVVLTSKGGHVPGDVKGNALLVTLKGFGRRQVTEAVGKFFILAGHVTKADVIRCTVASSSGLDDCNVPNSDDFKDVQERPEEKPLSRLEQFNEFMWKVRFISPYKELAQCPLHCVVMCCLVSERPKGQLPSTSGLYFAMINRNLYRAARKKAEAAGEDQEQWKLSALDSRIHWDHEGYLQDFGRLCINGLKTGSMSFSLFDITGDEEWAETSDVKVTQLIEAGVLVQDFLDRAPRYKVHHRTTAEFLAAYYLSGETDQISQLNLLDLFRLDASSFDGVAVFLIEMGKSKCLVDAFRVIKFPSDCLKSFMKSYFTQHGAAITWSEFKDALPNKLEARILSGDVIVSSAKPSGILLQLVEQFGKENIGETNALRSLPKPHCLVSLRVGYGFTGRNLPILLQTLLNSGVVLNSLEFRREDREYEISDQTRQEFARSLQELLKAYSCPVQLIFSSGTEDLLLPVTEAMQEVSEVCWLKSFHLDLGDDDTSVLSEVLVEKWLSHLQHLGMESKHWSSGNPILKRLTEPGCSLTSLHLSGIGNFMLLDNLMMLASKLETLQLENTNLYFDVTRLSKYAVMEKISLKRLHLVNVSLMLVGSRPLADQNQELFLAWRNVARNLEELTIDRCEFPVELFSWLNLTAPHLQTVKIGESGIEDLSLTYGFGESKGYILVLHRIREALQRSPRMKHVNLGNVEEIYILQGPIGPGPSTPLSFSDSEALEHNDIYLALFKIVLSVPKLQTLTSEFFFKYSEKVGTFRAIADMAKQWPGNRNDTSLTLHGLSKENAVFAMQVFREQGLKYCLKYVTENVYELWFPV